MKIGQTEAAVALLIVSRNSKRAAPASNAVAVETKPARETAEVPPATEPLPAPSIPTPAESPVSNADRTATSRQLIRSLSEVNLRPGELTPEKAAKWNRELEQLVEQGTAAVPPLQEFFESHADVRFDAGPGTNLLGVSSLRMAFLEVLFNIPTPDNVDLQEEVLRTTSDPAEVALLARQLEAQEPGKYRELIIPTVKAALQRSKGRLADRDANSLHGILGEYGVSEVE
jgi:hypothetical protein